MNIGLLIPQIYYDLIARITPGLILFATSFFVWKGHAITIQDIHTIFGWLASKDSPTMLMFLSYVIASYILAIVLDGIWMYFESITGYSHRVFNKLLDACTKKALSDFKTMNPNIEFVDLNYQFPGIALMYDFIRLQQPTIGARLVKLRAEFHMCRILMLGWSILAILNILNFYQNPYLTVSILEIFLLIGIGALIRTHKHLYERFIWGICNHWLLIKELRFADANENKGVATATNNRPKD